MSWRPASGPKVALERASLLARVRDYFEARDVLEVTTPALGNATVTDPAIDSLTIRDCAHAAGDLYLQTSPEFCMKRMLADGYPDIFSICRVFRDGELGGRHQPEFTMVEWYRRNFDQAQIIEDTIALVQHTLERRFELVRMSYRESFHDSLGIDPLKVPLNELKALASVDESLQASLGDRRQPWLDLLFASRVAPGFSSDALTVIDRYPAEQAALARLSPDDSLTAQRFELFFGDLELANGYVELGDADELRERFEDDLEIRRAGHQKLPPVDERFLHAMREGLPDCAGVALGFERLHMVAAGRDDIRDVVSFEFES